MAAKKLKDYVLNNNGQLVAQLPIETQREQMLDCIEEIAALLQGIMTSACNRFNIAFAITGGLDSRLLLAASRHVKERMYYFTHTTNNIKEDHPDINIPICMLADLNIKHNLVNFRESMENKFYDILKRNVTSARKMKGQFAYTIFEHFRSVGSVKTTYQRILVKR